MTSNNLSKFLAYGAFGHASGIGLQVRTVGRENWVSARGWGLQARLQRESALLFYGQAQTSYPLVSLLGGAPTSLPPCSVRIGTGDDIPGVNCYL